MRREFRGVLSVVAVSFVILLTGCSGGASSPTAPSPSPAPSPTPSPTSPPAPAPAPVPAPAPPPAPGFGLSAVSFSQSEVESQAQPQGTVTLTGAAPFGGAIVALSSSDPITVRVPASVTIAAGASSVAFTAITSTVTAATRATITATYADTTRAATLTVLPPALTASFTVRSPEKGSDSCILGPTADDVDCDTDGTPSRGFVEKWHWSYWTGGAPLAHTTTGGLSKPRFMNGCAFLDSARGGDNPDGSKYLQMTIELVVEDRAGSRSSAVRRSVKLYPNRLCGFGY
jgi:hypothetical protein